MCDCESKVTIIAQAVNIIEVLNFAENKRQGLSLGQREEDTKQAHLGTSENNRPNVIDRNLFLITYSS